jgi:cell division inhibitor SulA/protein ImuA
MGGGEVSLLLPALKAAMRDSRSIAWINPPCLPYAPALANAGVSLSQLLIVRSATPAETLWAAEQALRSGALGAVLLWLRQHVDYASLRRLHLAAEAGNCAAFVYRSTGFAMHPSPAPLRLCVEMDNNAPALTIIKRRGMMTSRRLKLNTSRTERKLPMLPAAASRPALALVAH